MAQQIINIGTTPGDNTGDTARQAGDKINQNFTELYTGIGQGVKVLYNQVAHGFISGQAVYRASGSFALARSDSAATSSAIGLVERVDDDNFYLWIAGEVDFMAGLVDGTTYFLSDSTAGASITPAPSGAGITAKPTFVATGTTTAIILPIAGWAADAS